MTLRVEKAGDRVIVTDDVYHIDYNIDNVFEVLELCSFVKRYNIVNVKYYACAMDAYPAYVVITHMCSLLNIEYKEV